MKEYLLKRVENIVAKGEIARFEQFLLLSQCFLKLSAAEASESVYMRERVNTLYAFIMTLFMLTALFSM